MAPKTLSQDQGMSASVDTPTSRISCKYGDVDTLESTANPNPIRLVLQHVGCDITKFAGGSTKISNPKLIQKILEEHGMENCNPTQVPYTINAD